jgi:hypothetical protein
MLYHYGKSGHFPQHPTLMGDRPAHHIVHCEVWHALTHMGPIHNFWRQMVELFPKRNVPEEAFCMARRLVLMAYQVRDAPHPLDRAKIVKPLLSEKLFLRGVTVGAQASFLLILLLTLFLSSHTMRQQSLATTLFIL